MIICNCCGAPFDAGLAFCSECGTAAGSLASPSYGPTSSGYTLRLVPSAAPDDSIDLPVNATGPASVNFNSLGVSVTPQRKTSLSKVTVVTIFGALATASLIIGAIVLSSKYLSNSHSADIVASSLKSAIQKGQLVTLSGNDAYSNFFQLKSLDPQHKALRETKSLLPQLVALGNEVFRKRISLSLEVVTENEWRIALQAFEWAQVMEPTDDKIKARWRYAEGHFARLQGRANLAESSLYSASQLDPGWAAPQNDLGYLYALSKRYYEAIPLYQAAINLQADWDVPYNNMGTAYFHQRDYDTAEEWYRKAIQVNGQWATPHAWLGSIYENKRSNEHAVHEYQIALSLYNPNRDRINTAELDKRIKALEASR